MDTNKILNLVLGLIMLGLGFSIEIKDIKNLFNNLRSVAVGLFAQMILLPLVAFLLANYFNLKPEYKVGIMILSFCPGGITSNLISYFIKANVTLGISLTICNAFISLFTIPILTNLSLKYFMNTEASIELPFWNTMFEIFIVTILPAAIGVWVRYKQENFAIKIEKYLNIVLPILLLIVFTLKFFEKDNSSENTSIYTLIITLSAVVITLNIVSMIIGYFLGIIFNLSHRDRLTSAIEVGLHNTALALLIAGEKLKNHSMEKPALVYALFSFAITFIVAYGIKVIREKIFLKQ